MAKFCKMPVEIDAAQWDGTEAGAETVADELSAPDGKIAYHHSSGRHGAPCLSIATLEGVMTAQAGDWIIRGIKGELYPCKPDIFAATYAPATRRPGEEVVSAR